MSLNQWALITPVPHPFTLWMKRMGLCSIGSNDIWRAGRGGGGRVARGGGGGGRVISWCHPPFTCSVVLREADPLCMSLLVLMNPLCRSPLALIIPLCMPL